MKKIHLWCIFTFLSLFFSFQEAEAQERRLYGYVTDSNNEPLIGVSVQIRGTQIATITDVKGRYQLMVILVKPQSFPLPM